MANRTVYGNTHSENGWPMVDRNSCRHVLIPGTNVRIWIREGQPEKILGAFAADFNRHVEPLRQEDTGGWTETNDVGSSNHLSGTAMDLNWQGPDKKRFRLGITEQQAYPPPKDAKLRELIKFYEGMVFCGGNWSIQDWMHMQMGGNTYGSQNVDKVNDFIARKIRPDGFSTFQSGPMDPNDFPLPQGYCWGPLDGPEWSVSGQFAGTPQAWKDGLKRWQKALGLPETGVWDGAVQAAATALQKDKGWPPVKMKRDGKEQTFHGCVFKGEWDAVIREGWRLVPTTPPPPPVKKFPNDWSDRELLLWLVEQVGVGHPSWPTYGTTLRDMVAKG